MSEANKFNIVEELKNIPTKPGVYIMFDVLDNIIYIGKAKNLKNRVKQYFNKNNKNNNIKNKYMIKKIKRFEYIITASEVDALILENTLIKKHSPKYNIRLKDDKTYPYVKINIKDMYPKVYITREFKADKAKYFGPYTPHTNNINISQTLEVIHDIFKIRTCNLSFPRDINKSRPCLNYQIGKCEAPCTGKVDKAEYNKKIKQITDLFMGRDTEIIKGLELEMNRLAEELEFEKASEVRDKMFALKKLNQNQLLDNAKNQDTQDKDIIGFARAFGEVVFQVFFVRGGKITGREHFILSNTEHLERSELLEEFIKQLYSGTAFIPKVILVQEDIQDKDNIESWLSAIKEQKVSIVVPKKGEKYKLVDMAYQNAVITLDKFGDQLKREHKRTIGAVQEIAKALDLNTILKRIEAYDISNTQGVQSVGSMVVFEDGKPLRTDYRKFKIKTVRGANDVASMKEVISRRFENYLNNNNSFNKLPDIIFIDGGTTQVNGVIKELKQLGLGDMLVCGMVKDDNHNTRGLLFKNQEVELKRSSEGFKLVTRIQDEAHRFAIEYHRKAREKAVITSVLDQIEGIGQKRKVALLQHFGSISNIKKASVDELNEVKGMTIKSSEAVYNYLNKDV